MGEIGTVDWTWAYNKQRQVSIRTLSFFRFRVDITIAGTCGVF